MTRTKTILLAGLGAMALAVAAQPAAAAKCVLAGGTGTGVSTGIATFMANAALGNSIKNAGLTPKGQPVVSCTTTLVVTDCTAKQKACK